jgi:threonyl-tRNA synthetase
MTETRKIGKKIRDAEIKKTPFMLIIGEKEQSESKVSIRKHGAGDIGTFTIDETIAFLQNEIAKDLNQSIKN